MSGRSMFRDLVRLVLTGMLLVGLASMPAHAQETPPSVSLTLDNSAQVLGGQALATAHIGGGVAPYSCLFEWSIQERDPATGGLLSYPVRTQTTSDQSDTLEIRLGEGGTVQVSVTDAKGAEVSARAISFTISGAVADPLRLSAGIDVENIDPGQTQVAKATAEGGALPYAYQFIWRSFVEDPLTHSESAQTFADEEGALSTHQATVPLADRGEVQVIVRDALGRRAEVFVPFNINEPNPLTATLGLSAESVALGEALTATARAEGGSGDYLYRFGWQVQERDPQSDAMTDWKTVRISDLSSEPADTATLPYGTHGQVFVTVIDGESNLERVAHFNIIGSPYDPILLTASLSNERPEPGDRVTASVDLAGGKPPYHVRYRWFEWVVSEVTSEEEQRGFAENAGEGLLADQQTIPAADRGEVLVSVSDSVGREAATWLDYRLAGAAPEPVLGDADDSGTLDLPDLLQIIDHILFGTVPDAPVLADIDGDGKLDLLDLTWVLDRLVE